jgi:hypothetical protein
MRVRGIRGGDRYVTFVEIPPRAENYPGAPPHMLKAGSLVFTPPDRLPLCSASASMILDLLPMPSGTSFPGRHSDGGLT